MVYIKAIIRITLHNSLLSTRLNSGAIGSVVARERGADRPVVAVVVAGVVGCFGESDGPRVEDVGVSVCAARDLGRDLRAGGGGARGFGDSGF